MSLAVMFGVAACLRGLDHPATIYYYRAIAPQTLGIETTTGAGAWTRVTAVVETSSTITVSVSSLDIPLVPRSDVGQWLELTVSLASPIDGRTVIDGSTGQKLGPAPSPWPPQLG